jgi:hypothetical protein
MYYSLRMGVTPANRTWFGTRHFRYARRALVCAVVFGVGLAMAQAPRGSAVDPGAFRMLVTQIAAARANGGPEPEAVQEQALAMLDRAALEELNGAASDLEALNRRLAARVTRQPSVGEGYRVMRLGGNPAAYALLANFGLSGPSAVRVYAGAPGKLELAARVDRFAQKDFLDDYMEAVSVAAGAPLFVTVAGRTDDLQTGVFTLWRFDGRGVMAVWSTDILQQSSYETAGDGFTLTYCADADPDDPRACRGMERDRYSWQDGAWKRTEATKLPGAAAK